MTESAAFLSAIIGVVVFIALIGIVAGGASMRRFMGRSFERGAMLILHDHDPRALYFVATVRGKDKARIKEGLARSARRPFVWMTQGGRDGEPGRALLIDALTEVIAEGDVVWAGQLTEEIEARVRAHLRRNGVELSALRLAGDVAFDDQARARNAWWVCDVDYELVAGRLCCDGLEFWMDSQGPALWSLKTRAQRITSADVAAKPEFQMRCHAAHELPPNILGGPLKQTRQLTLDDMTTPPAPAR